MAQAIRRADGSFRSVYSVVYDGAVLQPGETVVSMDEMPQTTPDALTPGEIAARFDGDPFTRAMVIWAAQKLGVPLATARGEILAIYKSLP